MQIVTQSSSTFHLLKVPVKLGVYPSTERPPLNGKKTET